MKVFEGEIVRASRGWLIGALVGAGMFAVVLAGLVWAWVVLS